MLDRLANYSPQALAILRIVSGLLFVQAGLQVLFNLPPYPGVETLMTDPMMVAAGVLELVGGLLILVGFLTRPMAFIMCGFMAVAYWGFHFPSSPFPSINMGVAAILYCFIFFYLFFAGPGTWSVDTMRQARA